MIPEETMPAAFFVIRSIVTDATSARSSTRPTS
jgi:hypothetical protein